MKIKESREKNFVNKIKLTKTGAFFLVAFFYVTGIIFYFIYDFGNKRGDLVKDIDANLRNGALAVMHILGDEYHDKIKDSTSVSEKENREITIKLTEFAYSVGLKYVYTVIKTADDKIVFTSSSATREDISNSEYPPFYDEYYEASDKMKAAFDNGKEFHEEEHDRWGFFRSVLIPVSTAKGTVYMVGADIEMREMDKAVFASLISSLVIALFLIAIAIPMVFIYYIFLRKEKEEFIKMVYTDKMTGLPNRDKLVLELNKVEAPILMLLNINSFKEVNDFYGHDMGDMALRAVAERLLSITTRDPFRVFRMNGDEFAVLFDAPMTQEEIEILARYFFEVISEEPFPINKSEVSVSVTLGLSTCSKLREIASEKESCSVRLVINADVALKKAKEMKKHFLVYEESMKITQEYEHNVKWTKKILSAIKENRIVPYFQPIINNETGVIEKYETLIRLVEIDGTVISPGLFLEPAKKSRLYCYLTRIVIMKAFDYFENINKEFSINISVDDILDDSTNRVLMNRLKEYKNNKNVIFEIIESEGIESYIKVIEFIQTIKLYGCKIAIDDFGSGYSNFEHILRLNVDYLKIDGGMIKNIDKDMNSFIITETIVDFAKKMGIKTVAEFVHNEGVFNKVKELGVDYSQGYYFGEPKPSTGRDDYN